MTQRQTQRRALKHRLRVAGGERSQGKRVLRVGFLLGGGQPCCDRQRQRRRKLLYIDAAYRSAVDIQQVLRSRGGPREDREIEPHSSSSSGSGGHSSQPSGSAFRAKKRNNWKRR